MSRDAVSRTANVGAWLRKRNGGKKWVKSQRSVSMIMLACSSERICNPMRYIYLISFNSLLPSKVLRASERAEH